MSLSEVQEHRLIFSFTSDKKKDVYKTAFDVTKFSFASLTKLIFCHKFIFFTF